MPSDARPTNAGVSAASGGNWDALFDGPALSEQSAPNVERARARRARADYRADIEGLRAVAVILVLADHLAPWPHGGFIGVDVFFVISGFLITGLLVRGASPGTSIGTYLSHFYRRRARRILPAACLVLAASWIAAAMVFRGARVGQSHSDILWALAFAANIHFARIGTDYFQQSQPPSLVQHFWSLAVEEQYYVVWPLVIFVVLFAVRRTSRGNGLGVLLLAISALSLVSFGWGLHESSANSIGAYFSTTGRAWELGLGSGLAVVLARHPTWPRSLAQVRGPLLLLSLAAIVVSASLLKAGSRVPAPAAALPALATAVIIFVGTGSTPARGWSWVLVNPASRYVGRLSYSLYLWHWPTIIIVDSLYAKHSPLHYAIIICALAGLSVLSYHLVEEQFHARPDGLRRERSTLVTQALVAVALLVAAVALYTIKPNPALPPELTAIQIEPSSTNPAASADPTVASASIGLQRQIATALGATSFPRLSPDLDHLGPSAAAREIWNGCSTLDGVSDTCRFGTGPKIAVVVGDSVAMDWIPAVRAALDPQQWTVYGYARGECPAALVSISKKLSGGAAGASTCDEHHGALSRTLNSLRPALVLVSSTETTLYHVAGASGQAAADAYLAGLEQTLRLAAATGASVVTLSPPPIGKSLLACDTAGAHPADCVARVSTLWSTFSGIDRRAAESTGTRYLDTERWFCSDSGYCPAFVGSTPVTYDSVHMTRSYGTTLGPELARALKP